MRIDQLRLERYGHFDNHVLDFSRPTGSADLHLIYGDNEAGKSTTYAALLDLLFGIPHKSRYAFRFDRKDLRIGAILRGKDTTQDLIRTGRGLSDASGNSVDELVLAELRNGLDRDSYSSMFSMDEDALKEGGEAILASKGELGSVLFSAGSGLGNLEADLQSLLSDPADTYYGSGAARVQKDWPLKKHLAGLKDIDDELKSLDVQATEWAKRREAVTQCELDCEAANKAFTAAVTAKTYAQSQLPRRERAMRLIADLKSLEDASPLPEIPQHWWENLDGYIHETESLLNQQRSFEGDIARLQKSQKGLSPDKNLLDRTSEIQSLRYEAPVLFNDEKKLADSEHQEQEIRRTAALVRQRLKLPTELPLEELDDPLLESSALARCRELGLQHGKLSEAAKQTAALQEEAQHTRAALDKPECHASTDFSALQRAVDDIDSDPQCSLLTALEKQHSALVNELQASLAQLTPWRGDADALAALNPPQERQLQLLGNTLTVAEQQRSECERKWKLANDELQHLLTNLPSVIDAPDDAQWQHLREEQWRFWRAHRDAVVAAAQQKTLQDTADQFESAMRTLETASIARDHNQASLAQRRNTEASIEQVKASLPGLDATRRSSIEHAEAAQQAIDDVATPLGLGAGLTITDFQRWLDLREVALATARKLDAVQRDLDSNIAWRDKQCERLSGLLVESGVAPDKDHNASLDQRVKQSKERIELLKEQESERKNLAEKIKDADESLARAEQSASAASEALSLWEDQWHCAVSSSFLAENTPDDAVRQLEDVAALAKATQEIRDIAAKREELAALRKRHDAAVTELRNQFVHVIDPERQNPLAALVSALEKAQQDHKLQTDNHLQLGQLQEQQQQFLETHKASLADVQERYTRTGVTSLHHLQSVLRSCKERIDRQAQIQQETTELQIEIEDDSADAICKLAARNPDDLESELRIAEDSYNQALALRDQCNQDLTSAQQSVAAIGGDNTVTLLRERRSALLQRLKDSAHAALAVRLGIGAAREGMRQWRAEHRSDMLRDAMASFVKLTNGRFVALNTEPTGGGGERLLTKDAAGNIKSADDLSLSKGTQYQLYLALRVAAYRRWSQHHGSPPPFVADDVLEAFDNDRTTSTFEVFHEMAHQGQVIYLTHHRHVVDIARKVTNDQVTVHELPSPSRIAAPA